MVKRAKVGLIYTNDENWIGGTYYIQNLVYALNCLNDGDKPELFIYTKTEIEFLQIKDTFYPYLQRKQLSYSQGSLPLLKRIFSKINYFFLNKHLYAQPLFMSDLSVDVIFPSDVALVVASTTKKIYWIPDFQEQKLPMFFTKKQILTRNQSHYLIAKSTDQVIFSSQDAFNDFKLLEPDFFCKAFVLNFAVTHPDFDDLKIDNLTVKYNLHKPFYFAPNQFWKHKNHMIILKAIKILKDNGIIDFIVAFSGKEYDGTNSEYCDSLKKFVKENDISSYVRFLGFIDRKEQLKLMKNSIAIIQPSLFEGWSTVVEDAKAMNQYIIASKINVHIEQLKTNVSFFNPNDSNELSNILETVIRNKILITKYDYHNNILKFANDFMNIIKQIH
jgi:glycosyltransferase involved in cell wall biosynthesis